jgi:hypothetical protein
MRKPGLLLLSFLLPSVLTLTAPAQNSQQPSSPCSEAEFRQFDFWVGEWQATWPGNKPGEVQHGHNSIRKVLGDCVVEEQFDGGEAMGLHGMSVSTYVPTARKWKQTWVDNQGGYLDFVGEFAGGQMILSRQGRSPQGQEVEQRMVYKNVTPDAFDWSWERSTDGGKTWNVVWPIHYTRRKA